MLYERKPTDEINKRAAVLSNWKSIGIELRPQILNLLNPISSYGFEHVQVTVPNAVNLDRLAEKCAGQITIVHSNLLNVLGDNDWNALSDAAKQIKSLKPIHVVEHFSLFVDSSGTKSAVGVPNPDDSQKAFAKAVENIKRWRVMLGCEVLIENAPVANGSDYLDRFVEVAALSDCPIALDIPHLIISLCGPQLHDALSKFVQLLKPKQIHLGGLRENNGVLRDNHNNLSSDLCEFAEFVFPGAEYITFEQGPMIPIKQLQLWKAQLRAQSAGAKLAPEKYRNVVSLTFDEVNDSLAQEAAADLRLNCVVRKLDATLNLQENLALNRFETLTPFFYPLSSAAIELSALDAKTALQRLVQLAFEINRFNSLWKTNSNEVVLGFGTNEDCVVHQRRLISTDKPTTRLDANRFWKIKCADNNWVGLSTSG